MIYCSLELFPPKVVEPSSGFCYIQEACFFQRNGSREPVDQSA